MLRDKLRARLDAMGDAPDHQRLVEEVLGIRGAPPELARRLVAQALVVEDRQEIWRQAGARLCKDAPRSPGVYILRGEDGRALYVGKALNLHRRLSTHFSGRRWRAMQPALSRVVDAEWHEVGSELEALLREAELIHELQPIVNVQTGPPDFATRDVPAALVRDVVVIVPSIDQDRAVLIGARPDGGWIMQRTPRNGAELVVHTQRLLRFFVGRLSARKALPEGGSRLAPIVFSWLAGRRGSEATRLDPHDAPSARALRGRLAALLQDRALFVERLDQRSLP
jgi:predicted GIY-YIG superfamily endonuclease